MSSLPFEISLTAKPTDRNPKSTADSRPGGEEINSESSVWIRIRIGNWMLTERGLFRLRWHYDKKTGGQKARWRQWDKVL